MTKDKYYSEACDNAREMAHHGHHQTQEQVEAYAEKLRIGAMIDNLSELKLEENRPPAAYRHE